MGEDSGEAQDMVYRTAWLRAELGSVHCDYTAACVARLNAVTMAALLWVRQLCTGTHTLCEQDDPDAVTIALCETSDKAKATAYCNRLLGVEYEDSSKPWMRFGTSFASWTGLLTTHGAQIVQRSNTPTSWAEHCLAAAA